MRRGLPQIMSMRAYLNKIRCIEQFSFFVEGNIFFT